MITGRSASPFEVKDVEKPVAGPGQVLVHVAAISVNAVDTMVRSMGPEQLPFSPQGPLIARGFYADPNAA